IVLILNNIYAIGITPGRTTVNFKPGLSKDVSFSILNSEHKEMSVAFSVRGNLSEYIEFDQNSVEFSESEESKSFTYTINLPEDYEEFGEPGTHKAEIVALELPKDIPEDSKEGPSFVASVAVVTQLFVDVPYPDKYAEASIETISSPNEVVFIIPVNNKGKLDIVESNAIIDIYNQENNKIKTLKTNTKSIDALKREDLSAEWDTSDVPSGKYTAKADVFYDDEVISLEKQFEVGQRALEIIEIDVDDFTLGEIAKFEALVENKWSEKIKKAYLNIIVYNEEDEVMADFKSPTYDIPSSRKEKMISYWDTAGVQEGTYDGKLILRYENNSDERNIQLKVSENDIEVIGITGRAIVDDGGGFSMTVLLGIVIALLVMINIIWFFIVKRLMDKRKNK
ncbi:MAG: hypothetical protein ACOC1K_05825, partial [Nanoarchaeota archaeon]